MKKEIRWGILGCGRIARKFASDLQFSENCHLIAIGASNAGSAANFALEFPCEHVHHSYEDLVKNPEVDVIYVATPHGLHHEHVMLCLSHGKPVLCEKAFALNARQAREMIALAKDRNLFLMEALWSKFAPHYKLLLEYVKTGRIGEVKNVLINFGFVPPVPGPTRLFDPALGGGSLLDIGIYNLFFATSVLGKPDDIEAWITPAPTGVDEQCSILLRYKNGAMASLFSSYSSNLATEADFSGTGGRIRLGSRFYEPNSTSFTYYEGKEAGVDVSFERGPGWGYHYEISHVNECLRKGLTESPIMTHQDSLDLMELMDEVRRKSGFRYPVD